MTLKMTLLLQKTRLTSLHPLKELENINRILTMILVSTALGYLSNLRNKADNANNIVYILLEF